jgi:hypothetical protein
MMRFAKPAAKVAARETIKGMATAGIDSLANKTVESVKRKRKSTKLHSKRRRR